MTVKKSLNVLVTVLAMNTASKFGKQIFNLRRDRFQSLLMKMS